MQNIIDRIQSYKLLLYSRDIDGTLQISRHKVIILLLYILSFIFTFLHFAFIPEEAKLDCIESFSRGEIPQLPLSSYLILTFLCYTYITIMAIYSGLKNGSLPRKLFINPLKLRTRYKILFVIAIFVFLGGIIAIIAYIAILAVFFSFGIGFYMFAIWMILEPFFLFGGVLTLINIITSDYRIEGYSKKTKLSLLGIFLTASIGPSFLFIRLLGVDTTQSEFIEVNIPLFSNSIVLYQPAVDSFISTFSSLLGITLLFIIIWYIKDRITGTNNVREQKKGILPIFLALTLLFAGVKIIPIVISTRGSFQEITDIIDLLGLFTAIVLGLWQVINLEQHQEPLLSWERINPIKWIDRLHPYSKALFLFVLSMFAFFATLNASTLAIITNSPDELQLQELNLLAGLLGVAFIYTLWRYKGRIERTQPGILKSTQTILSQKMGFIKKVEEE